MGRIFNSYAIRIFFLFDTVDEGICPHNISDVQFAYSLQIKAYIWCIYWITTVFLTSQAWQIFCNYRFGVVAAYLESYISWIAGVCAGPPMAVMVFAHCGVALSWPTWLIRICKQDLQVNRRSDLGKRLIKSTRPLLVLVQNYNTIK